MCVADVSVGAVGIKRSRSCNWCPCTICIGSVPVSNSARRRRLRGLGNCRRRLLRIFCDGPGESQKRRMYSSRSR